MKKLFSKLGLIALLHVTVFALSFGIASAYSYAGFKWAGTSANYYINSAFAPSFRTAMQAADAAWDNAGSKFRFYYQGTTSRNPNVWSHTPDGYNDIGFHYKGNTGIVVLAGVISKLNGTTIIETDTTFNTSNSFTTIGSAGMYDVQNVMTHEFGHWLKLNDLSSGWSPSWCGISSWEATMCSVIYPNETNKRSLEGDDKAGIKFIHGI
jgi:hypothetical protein